MALAVPKRQRVGVSHHRSRSQEKELAYRVGGKTTPASGALDVKGDVRVKGVMRIEAKTTQHKSFSLTREMLRKIEDAGLASGELPAMEIEFHDKGKPVYRVAVVPVYVLEMMGLWKRGAYAAA